MVFELVIPDFNMGLGIGFILGIIFIFLISFLIKPTEITHEIPGLDKKG